MYLGSFALAWLAQPYYTSNCTSQLPAMSHVMAQEEAALVLLSKPLFNTKGEQCPSNASTIVITFIQAAS